MAVETISNTLDVILENIEEISGNLVLIRKIDDYLVEKHNFEKGQAYVYVRNIEQLSSLSEIELACFVTAVHERTSLEVFDPTLHFTPATLKKAKKYKYEIKDERLKEGLPYTFKSVLRSDSDSFLTVLTYREIYELFVAGLLNYNYDTQRIAKKKVKRGTIFIEPKLYKKSVTKIYELMKNKLYPPSTILLNILEDGESAIEYNDGDLTIHKGSQIDLIDGYHRTQAIVKLISEFPDFEGCMNVDIKFYDITKARKLLAITNTTNPFDKTQRMKFASATFGSEIVNELEKLPELKNKISSKGSVSVNLGEITTFSVMVESIDELFDIQNAKEKFEVLKFLKQFYPYFLSVYDEEFKNKKENINNTWFVHHNMFVLFNVLAKKMFDKYKFDAPLDEITNILSKINFNKNEDTPLNNLMVSQGKVNSVKIKKELMKFAKEKIEL